MEGLPKSPFQRVKESIFGSEEDNFDVKEDEETAEVLPVLSDGVIDCSLCVEDGRNYIIQNLQPGLTLQNVFITPNGRSRRLPFRINGLFLEFPSYAVLPESGDYYDLGIEYVAFNENTIRVVLLNEEESAEDGVTPGYLVDTGEEEKPEENEQSQSLGDILKESLESRQVSEASTFLKPIDGVIDLTPLGKNQGILKFESTKEGLILKNFYIDVATISNRGGGVRQIGTFVRETGDEEGIFLEGDIKPTESGFYDVRILISDDYMDVEIVSQSETIQQDKVFTVTDGTVEIPTLSQRLDFQYEKSVDITIDPLVRGVVLKNVFLAENSFDQPFRLNGKSVFLYDTAPPKDGNYDIEVVVVGKDPNNYIECRIVDKSDMQDPNLETSVTNFERGTSFEIGSVVNNVRFKERTGGGYVSENPTGKAFLLDEDFSYSEDVFFGDPVTVKIIRDTKPGKSDGFYIVRLVDTETPQSETGVRPLVVENGQLDLQKLYDGRTETNLRIGNLKVGDRLKNVFLRGEERSRLDTLTINDLPVYLEGSKTPTYNGPYDVVVEVQDGSYIDVIIAPSPEDYDLSLSLENDAVDLRYFDSTQYLDEKPNIYVEGLREGSIIKNLNIDETFLASGSEFPNTLRSLKINDRVLEYVGGVSIPKTGQYDFEVRSKNSYSFEIVLTPETIESFDRTERVTFYDNELASEPLHEAFLKNQVDNLRTPSLQAALQQARMGIPELSSGREVLARSREMRQMEDKDERHRHFTALGSAMYRERGAYRSFNAGVDVAVEHASQRTREWLKSWEGPEPPRLPLLVVGSGPHGATFLSTFAMYNQTHEPLVVDQRKHIGGQFADAELPVFRLNSRNRPQMEGSDREERNLPGSQQTINPLGTMATLQVSDVSGEAYVTQDALAYATRFNSITSADEFLTRCRLLSAKHTIRNDNSETERCTFFDEQDKRVYTIDVDELVIAGGIGKDVFNLKDQDSQTRRDLAIESEKLARGERPLVMSFPQMVSWFGNPQNRSPLKGVKDVIVSGSGDSANVAIGILLGYEPGSDRMPTSLDRVEKVYWMGQDIPSKEQWLQQVRTRYAQIGLEFPRNRIEEYYSRIIPIKSKVSDVFTNEDENKVGVLSPTEVGAEADLYIACNGFQDDLGSVLAGNGAVTERVSSRSFVSTSSDELVKKYIKPGTIIKNDPFIEYRIINVTDDKVEYLFDDQISTTSILNFRETLSELPGDYEVSVPRRGIEYEELYDEEGFAVSKRVAGTNISLVGPAAGLTLSRQEKRTAPVLEQIPENTAALFRYGRGTEKTARLIADRLNNTRNKKYDMIPQPTELTLKKATTTVRATGAMINLSKNSRETPYHIEHQAALKLALADYFDPMEFPANLSDVELSVKISPYVTRGQNPFFEVSGLGVANLSEKDSDDRLANWLQDIASDSVVATAIEQAAAAHAKSVRGKEPLKAAEINRKRAELESLTGSRFPVERPTEGNTLSLLKLRIPIKGSKANVSELSYTWEDTR